MLETFGLSNVCPQVGRGFNRCACCFCAEQRDNEVLLKSSVGCCIPCRHKSPFDSDKLTISCLCSL